MSKGQIYLLGAGACLVLLLSLLPTSVVDNKPTSFSSEGKKQVENGREDSLSALHAAPLSEAMLTSISLHRKTFLAATTEAGRKESLEKLLELFIQASRYDSAAYYAEAFATSYPSDESLQRAGDLYYDGFGFAMSQEKAQRFAEKARAIYGQLLEKNSKLLTVKVKIGMTYVATSPMQGVGMIKEVLQEDPNNHFALMQMALLSMKSGQFEKVPQHLEKLISLDPKNLEAKFYLGISYAELGRKEDAEKLLHQVEEEATDPSILQTAKQYLDKLHQ